MKAKLLNTHVLVGTMAFGLCLWSFGCANHHVPTTTVNAKVDRLFSKWNRPDSPGVAVVVVKDGTVVFQRGFGCSNLEHGIPITPRTVFDAASVAKQFTGLAIAILIEQGKLSLDDDIRKHLPDVPDFGAPITIRHLLHHTSGLRDWPVTLALSGTAWSDPITMGKILGMVSRQRELNFASGETSLYSNTGYNLLAAIVSKVTGQSFRGWTQANLFQPLGMLHTHFYDDPTEVIWQRAESYAPARSGTFQHIVSQLAAPGSSSLMITAEDMGKWLINLETARVGGRAAIEALKTRGRLNSGTNFAYGFGLALDRYRDLDAESHGGGWAGYRSAVLRLPAKRLAVAILSNNSTMDAEKLTKEVADVFLGLEFIPEPIEKPAKPSAPSPAMNVEPLALREYTGDYWSDELQAAYRIEIHDGNLTIGHCLRGSAKMIPRGPDRFDTEELPEIDLSASVEFLRNPGLDVTGFKLSARRVRNLRFSRVSLP